MKFNKNQIEIMQKIGMSVDFSEALSETDYEIIEEKISHYLQKKALILIINRQKMEGCVNLF